MGRMPRGYYRPYLSPRAYSITEGKSVAQLRRALQTHAVELRQALANLKTAHELTAAALSKEANAELVRRIEANPYRRRADPRRNQALVRMTADHTRNSTWDENGFIFWNTRRINRSAVRRYWRAVEEGSNFWVQESAKRGGGLVFWRNGKPTRSFTSFDNVSYVSGRGFGQVGKVNLAKPGREGERRHARRGQITRPIPAYHYIQHAENVIRTRRTYQMLVNQAVANVARQRSGGSPAWGGGSIGQVSFGRTGKARIN